VVRPGSGVHGLEQITFTNGGGGCLGDTVSRPIDAGGNVGGSRALVLQLKEEVFCCVRYSLPYEPPSLRRQRFLNGVKGITTAWLTGLI